MCGGKFITRRTMYNSKIYFSPTHSFFLPALPQTSSRDPRAALVSKSGASDFSWLENNIGKASARRCSKLSEDLKYLRRLKDFFPGRVKLIRYEDGVLDPHGYAASIYEFLGLPVTKNLTVNKKIYGLLVYLSHIT